MIGFRPAATTVHTLQGSCGNPLPPGTGSISRQHYRYAGVSIVVPAILKHTQLEHSVGHLLFSGCSATMVKQLDFYSLAF